jgi:hypothetical protein
VNLKMKFVSQYEISLFGAIVNKGLIHKNFNLTQSTHFTTLSPRLSLNSLPSLEKIFKNIKLSREREREFYGQSCLPLPRCRNDRAQTDKKLKSYFTAQ